MLSTVPRYASLVTTEAERGILSIFAINIVSSDVKIVSDTFHFMYSCEQVFLLPDKSKC